MGIFSFINPRYVDTDSQAHQVKDNCAIAIPLPGPFALLPGCRPTKQKRTPGEELKQASFPQQASWPSQFSVMKINLSETFAPVNKRKTQITQIAIVQFA
jgi:hypothetical protein